MALATLWQFIFANVLLDYVFLYSISAKEAVGKY